MPLRDPGRHVEITKRSVERELWIATVAGEMMGEISLLEHAAQCDRACRHGLPRAENHSRHFQDFFPRARPQWPCCEL